MTEFINKLTFILTIAIVLAISPLCGAYSACQKLGEYCGSPPTETFPACCPFDTNSNNEQTPLKCKNIDNGVGTCETVENSGSSSGQED